MDENQKQCFAFILDLKKKEREHAKELAILWKGKISPRSSSLDVLAFLQFIVAYRLQKSFIISQELASSIAHYKEAPPTLFQSLGLHSEVPEFVEELMNKGQYIPAVRLICFFKLQGFFPLHLLRKEIANLRIQAEDKDGGNLIEILELMADYKLEIDIPGEVIVKLMDLRVHGIGLIVMIKGLERMLAGLIKYSVVVLKISFKFDGIYIYIFQLLALNYISQSPISWNYFKII